MSFLRILLRKASPRIATAKVRSCTTRVKNLDEADKPIEYSKSPASGWKAAYSRTGTSTERLWYEPIVILGSITVFMIYFCILREENDIDRELDKTLYQRIKGLEEKQLLLSLQYNKEHGLDTKAIKDRLDEIERLKNA